LADRFATVEAIAQLDFDQLRNVDGIGEVGAAIRYQTIHESGPQAESLASQGTRG